MKEPLEHSGRIWAYVHGELSVPERSQLEEAAAADPGLKRLIERALQMDREMRRLAPYVQMTEQELQERLLEAWEHDRAQEGRVAKADLGPLPDLAPLPPPKARRRPIIWMPRPVFSLVAAAAVLLIAVVGIRFYQPGPLAWSEPELVLVSRYRGADGVEHETVYTRQQLADLSEALRKAVSAEYTDPGAGAPGRRSWLGRADWVLSTRFEEMRAGKLGVTVRAHSARDEKLRREWTQYYTNAQVFLAQVNEYGARIAADLRDLAATSGGG